MSKLNLRKYEHSFLILASLLLAIVNTLPFYAGIFKGTSGNENPWMNRDVYINLSIWYSLQSFFAILIYAYFNYRLVDFLISPKASKTIRILLKIFYNILLIALILIATVYIGDVTIGSPFGIKRAFNWYAWRNIGLYPPALLVAYILILITKTKIMEIENIKLKEENISSQLKSLREQVNPHFLFNTLNTLSSVIRLDKKQDALRFVDDLSKVYRYILESNKNNLVKVKSELDFLNSYIFMLKKRYGDKLEIDIDLTEQILESYIPPMVLEVVVENAIKHNRISTNSPLVVKLYTENNYLVVKNNIQAKKTDQDNFGLGLPNLIKRYELITGKDVIIRQTNRHFIVNLPIISRK
ncbi:MAG: histidine kinase [Bacteroidales bacterium]|nr:histidine kinase [Bacteroidales bacterium]MCF8344480.1 histidine kinase [Bacteroidales bacterium]MCF8352074.1 histidine kinase [Bacteroidales bacterium]MCF8377348.1 histidine kinase [Bacteroidales bacterium]MCF8401906.1 histidine kinase [Bacteroidales bacterium]